MNKRPRDVEFLVVGSGISGLVGAITARKAGLRPVIVEKSPVWGGTTAISGGVLWVPANPLMSAEDRAHQQSKAKTYLNNLIEEHPLKAKKIQAFLEKAPEMIGMLGEEGIRWRRNLEHPDYYQTVEGASKGCSLECAVADGRRLGPLLQTMRGKDLPVLAFSSSLSGRLMRAWTGPGPFATAAGVVITNWFWRRLGRKPLGLGRALVASLMEVAVRLEIPVLLETRLVSLRVANGVIVGARLGDSDGEFDLSCTNGILLSSGGFAHNAEIRRRYQTVDGSYSIAIQEEQGDALTAAVACGAATDQMDSAWWMPSLMTLTGQPTITMGERAMPGSIIVDETGKRFINESMSYMAVGKELAARWKPGSKYWLIADDRFMRRYIHRVFGNSKTRQSLLDAGLLFKAQTLGQLAERCSLPGNAVAQTVERFNMFAKSGKDEDFARGDTIYDVYWADPANRPNPSLGRLARAPFWAAQIYPGDLGVNGGLLTDELGQVLRDDGVPIRGVFAAGNASSGPFGRNYPGAGATLAAAATFGFIAARSAASLTANHDGVLVEA